MEMTRDNKFHYWEDPKQNEIGETTEEFLNILPGPTHILVRGRDRSRCRAVVTLIHGNEPSGFNALFHILKKQQDAAVDIHFFLPGVVTARESPLFSNRMLPGHKDLNRCFKPPFDDSLEDQIASELLTTLAQIRPECLVDIHNTSGSGPSFGVSTFRDTRHDSLISMFTHNVIITDLTLGALMEISNKNLPAVTIECGGSADPGSIPLAISGLEKYMNSNDVFSNSVGTSLNFFLHPVRLEIKPGTNISIGDQPQHQVGVTLLPDIEQHNFGAIGPDTKLGYIAGNINELLTVKNHHGQEHLPDFFSACDGVLKPRCQLKLFMATTNIEIVKSDCLFYLVPEG